MCRRFLGLVLVAWIAGAAGTILGSVFYLNHVSVGKVIAGVSIAGTEVGGLTAGELRQKLAEIDRRWRERELVLRLPGPKGKSSVWQVPVGTTGLRLDIAATANRALGLGESGGLLANLQVLFTARRVGLPLTAELTFDPVQKEKFLTGLQRRVERDFVPPRYDYRTGRVVKGQAACSLLREETWKRILAAARSGSMEAEVAAKVEQHSPLLRSLHPSDFAVTLARFATPLGPSGLGRVHNIRLAAELLNGRILLPGDVLSFNAAVGPRTLERGFAFAPEIVNQELVEGVGGGICQVSSTLYNAALLGGLEILERRNHSRPLGYVPLGRDATVYYGMLDLELKNPHSFPVAVAAGIDDWHIWVSILGRSRPYESIQVVGRELAVIEPSVTYVSPDGREKWNKLPPGMVPVEMVEEGWNGYRVAVYRVIDTGETEIQELISRDYYPAAPQVWRVAPAASKNP